MAGLGPWSSEVKNAVTETKLASRDFDPDRRLDVDVPAREAELRHPFDPDARVNPVDDGRPTIGEAGGSPTRPRWSTPTSHHKRRSRSIPQHT